MMTPRRILVLSILLIVGLMVGTSLLVLNGVSRTMGSNEISTQLKWVAISIVVMAVFALLPFRWILGRAYFFYALGIALLLAVMFGGKSINGSARWIVIGGFSLQPSEAMKFAYLLALARVLRFGREIDTFVDLMKPALLVLPPLALIILQPNLSTTILFLPVTFGVLYVAGAHRRPMLVILSAVAVVAVVGAVFFLAPYQKDRILSTIMRDRLAPAERQREGYQLEQSLRSIGIGGFFGAGPGDGVQNNLDRLAFRHNDFIFAVFVEEFGFFGGALLMLAVFLLTALFVRTAYTTRDPAARLFVAGAAILLGSQSLIHFGVNLGIIPTTGMTLPFFSAGGSSLLTFSAILGTVLSVARRPLTVFAGDANFEQIERLRRG